ncbi:membrane hypothetical protein [Candidatus Sulfopaludibacter sp. SbA4]|nr:membrane hypothetical protein [Candidatus Sulfopaludibacter sp. SbA4]
MLGDFYRRRFFRIAKGIGIALLLMAACDLYRPMRPIGSAFAGILAFCAAPFLYGLHRNAVRADRGVAALMANPWVHWEFTHAEWQAVADVQFPQRSKPFTWRRQWPVGLTTVAAGTFGAWIFGGSPPVILGAFVFFALCPIACNWFFGRDMRAQHRRMMAAPTKVWLGPDGLLLGSQFTPWVSSEFRLERAAVQSAAPARLVLRFRVSPSLTYSSRPYFHRSVPLSAGSGRDLELLQQKLRSAFPKAEIAVV